MNPNEVLSGLLNYALTHIPGQLRDTEESKSELELACNDQEYHNRSFSTQENPPMNGTLVYMNGKTISQTLSKSGVVKAQNIGKFQDIESLDELLGEVVGGDGAIVINGREDRYAIARELIKNPRPIRRLIRGKRDLSEYVTEDFPNEELAAAAIIPPLGDKRVKSFLIDEGYRTIAQFGEYGLERTIHIEESSEGKFVAKYTEYRTGDGTRVASHSHVIDLSKERYEWFEKPDSQQEFVGLSLEPFPYAS